MQWFIHTLYLSNRPIIEKIFQLSFNIKLLNWIIIIIVIYFISINFSIHSSNQNLSPWSMYIKSQLVDNPLFEDTLSNILLVSRFMNWNELNKVIYLFGTLFKLTTVMNSRMFMYGVYMAYSSILPLH